MFFTPWYFLLLPLVVLLGWRLFSANRNSGVGFSHTSFAKLMTPSLRQRLLWLPKLLLLLSMVLLVLGLARPRDGQTRTLTESTGIAIEMVVDRSGSMRALDFKIDGNHVDRLTAVKNVASKFVLGEGDLGGRFNDLVGLISFAGYADGVTPPTLDHGFLAASLNQTSIVRRRAEDGTAIGDAIALAVEKLNALNESRELEIQSKVIILLTDGENTAGELQPIEAAELAQSFDIKIYTIGVGTKGQAPIPVTDAFTGRQVIRNRQVNIDEETLQQVADKTGGKYFRATDTDSLTEIYGEIDRLEKTEIEMQNFVDYRELALQSQRLSWITIPPMLLLSLVLLMAGFFLQQTWLKEVTV